MLFFLWLTCVGYLFSSAIHARDVLPRKPLPQHPISVPDAKAQQLSVRLTIKFLDEWKMRAQEDGTLSSDEQYNINRLDRLIEQHDLQFRQLILLPDITIERLEKRAEALSMVWISCQHM